MTVNDISRHPARRARNRAGARADDRRRARQARHDPQEARPRPGGGRRVRHVRTGARQRRRDQAGRRRQHRHLLPGRSDPQLERRDERRRHQARPSQGLQPRHAAGEGRLDPARRLPDAARPDRGPRRVQDGRRPRRDAPPGHPGRTGGRQDHDRARAALVPADRRRPRPRAGDAARDRRRHAQARGHAHRAAGPVVRGRGNAGPATRLLPRETATGSGGDRARCVSSWPA